MKSLIVVSFFCVITFNPIHAQDEPEIDNQLWVFGLFNWRLDERWVFGQDFGYMHLYSTPIFTRIFVRSQINRQITGSFSMHGGINSILKLHEEANNALEIRPWLGTKLRWPYFWRFDFVQYLRFEQQFELTLGENDWNNNFRVRYKISSKVPVNHNSLIDKTIYGIVGYEIYSGSFGADFRFTASAVHRVELGIGYRQNVKSSYEAVIILFNTRNIDTEIYSFSTAILFLKYKRYMHWE